VLGRDLYRLGAGDGLEGFGFTAAMGGARRGCRAGWGASVRDDTYLSHLMELGQAQHGYGKVRSSSTR
jgi:hypothetical protein